MYLFTRQFLEDYAGVGSPLPSSKYVADLILRQVDFSQLESIVEFGPGTGAFTEGILERMDVNTLFFCIEKNKEFYGMLVRKYPCIPVYNDSADQIGSYLGRFGLTGVDAIISSLPWSNFEESLQARILKETSDSLNPGGRFITIAYKPWHMLRKGRRFSKLLHEYFSDVKETRTVWLNVFPTFAYVCGKDEE
ncbi:MAG TPA: ribosomal RNA adenine dimethylase domain-containing protein [Candidatus Nanoarchaeia archaeon]|nr:ribosomal RNA adenine dimethylase domain-containing protein [Candidatus Nanoarchaeia archaeon]